MVKTELLKALGEEITEMLKPQIENFIMNSLVMEWKGKYRDFMISNEQFKREMIEFVNKLISRFNSRKHYGSIMHFIRNNVLQPYIMMAFRNKRYIANGLNRFDVISYDTVELALDFIYTALFFLPVFDVTLPIKVIMPQYQGDGSRSVSFREAEDNSIVRQSFLMKIKEIIKGQFPSISPYFVDIVTKTFYLAEENEEVPYSSKMLKLVYTFAINWKKINKERGAESFDASWLNVARINYKFFAYDLATVEEFYKIAIEEGL